MDGPVMQRENERGRVVVEGRLVDGSGRCTIVAVYLRMPRCWVIYPHGVEKMGIELTEKDAAAFANGIIQLQS